MFTLFIMPSRISNQFNSLYNGLKNKTNTASVPQKMREEYTESIIESIKKTNKGLNEGFNLVTNRKYIDHSGSFIIELYPSAIERHSIKYPDDVKLEGTTLTIPNGSINNGGGGFNIESKSGGPFLGAGYTHIKNVQDGNGNILWENWDETKKKP